MPFGQKERKEIRERSGYFCQICGEWHPPRRRGETELDAHSLDLSHKDGGMTVCRARVAGECHGKLHQVTRDPDELQKVSREAVSLATLSLAVTMVDSGAPERRIRRVIRRMGRID